MQQGEVEKAAELLGTMRELELALEAFYSACAAAFPTETSFWQPIATQERHHAENLERMIDLVAERPERYSWGRMFRPQAVMTMVTGVRAKTESVKRAELDSRAALLLARGYEDSLLEGRYEEVLRTQEPGYAALAREILEQTKAHKAGIAHRVAALTQAR
jgi:hypothetical protein